MNPVFSFLTLGCRLNQAEEEKLRRQVMESGFLISNPETADFCIVNTCSVTAIADRKSRKVIQKLKIKNKELKIIAIGCSVEKAKDIPEVKLSIPNERKSEALKEIIKKFNINNSNLNNNYELKIKNSASKRTRALLKIQDGCNNFCAYCIVPFLRGREVSVDSKEVIVEAKKLKTMSFQELVLSGVNVGKYDSNELNLTKIIEKLLSETGFKRIRLSSINPQDITDDLIQLWKRNERLCRHFHLSLQSGSTSVLKRMGRPYTAKEYQQLSTKIIHEIPDMAITTDVIVGFPGETEEEFAETCEFVKKANLAKLHVFPYSERSGTKAARMPEQVSAEVKKLRASKLRVIGKELEKEFKSKFIGKNIEVLFEEKKPARIGQGGDGDWYGLTSNYIRIKYQSKEDLENQFKIIRLNKENLA